VPKIEALNMVDYENEELLIETEPEDFDFVEEGEVGT